MNGLRFTLRSDGPSDRALIPLLTWLLREHNVKVPIQAEWADLRRVRQPHRTLTEQLKWSLELYPCDLLFVHRDAENQGRDQRVTEINRALEQLTNVAIPPVIPVVPVRMQEAWLLCDEMAIRDAVGNPHGKQELQLPPLRRIENLPDPKMVLHNLLRIASGRHGRRLEQLNISNSLNRLAEFIDDFSPLRNLQSFQLLENDVERVIQEQGWNV